MKIYNIKELNYYGTIEEENQAVKKSKIKEMKCVLIVFENNSFTKFTAEIRVLE